MESKERAWKSGKGGERKREGTSTFLGPSQFSVCAGFLRPL